MWEAELMDPESKFVLSHVQDGTARLMSKAQVRRSLAFAKREDQKTALGWWGFTAYNWCRLHRSLRCLLPQPKGKKSISTVPLQWLSA